MTARVYRDDEVVMRAPDDRPLAVRYCNDPACDCGMAGESSLRAQIDEAVALLRSSAWRLACESRNDLAVKNDRLQARNIESFLSRLDAAKGTK